MVLTEIVLIILGIVAFVASFFVTERLSQKDLDQITRMSEADLKTIVERQIKEVKVQVENSVEEVIGEALEITQRGLDRETNQKIMAVSEYSDTVLEEINKTHNEIMFLYSMLNDKQAEAADMVVDLQKLTKQVREMDLERVLHATSTTVEKTVETVTTPKASTAEAAKESKAEKQADDATMSKNEQILLLYKEGKDEVEIAKTLDCGLGVVRLVLGLYHEA